MPVLELPALETVRINEAEFEEICSYDARFELWNGELKSMPPTGSEHGHVTIDLSTLVNMHVLQHNLGRCYAAETGFKVRESPLTILAPDFAFVQSARLPAQDSRGFLPVVPDLVLETRSPHDRPGDVATKVALWLEVGAQIVWELNPRRQILTVFAPDSAPRELGANDTLDAPALLPGWDLALNRILRD